MNGGGQGSGPGRAGRVLAARWSIERLRRPAGPGLVWLGYAKPEVMVFECLACGAGGFKQGVLRAEGRTLYLCAECASHQFHPPPPPAAAPEGFSRRQLLENGLDLPGAAATAARVMAGRKAGRLLDVGCQLGLVVDVVRQQPGWTATGIDPGGLADLGAQALDAPVRSGGAEAVGASGGAFDVLLCEGALDRSPDPLALLRAMAELAVPRWLLAVPDAAVIYAAEDAGSVLRLARDARVLVPSEVGLRRLLSRAGLPELEVRAADGLLHARRGGAATRGAPDAGVLLDRYFAVRDAAPPPDASAVVGIQVRGLERAVERADWPAARRLLARLAPALTAAGEAARAADPVSLERLFRAAPLCSSALLHQAGLLHLHGSGASTQALMCFELAALLAGQSVALAPTPAEAERYWAARFHAAQVTRLLGDAARSLAAFEAIAGGQRGVPPSPLWTARARAEAEAEAVPPPAKRRSRVRAAP